MSHIELSAGRKVDALASRMSSTEPRPCVAALTGNLMLGGAATFLLNLFAGMRERDYDLRVACLSRLNEHRADFEGVGAEVKEVDAVSQIYEDRLAQAYRSLASWKPEMVLACLSPESFEVLRLVPPGVLRVGLIQSDDPGPYATAARFAPWIDVIVGVSAQICANLREMPEFASARVACIPYGIAFGHSELRAPRPPGVPLRVIYVGRLIEAQKRISRIAEVIERLFAEGAPVRFTIAGAGTEEPWLRERLAGIPTVAWLGALPNTRVRNILQDQDVFLLLSDFEGLPLGLLEAMGEGVVPVVSDLPSGMREAVPDNTGVRVAIGDVPAAVAALRALAADPMRTAALSHAAAQHARTHFSALRMADDFLALRSSEGKPTIWPAEAHVPVPLGQDRPWLFAPVIRPLRRVVKRLPFRSVPAHPYELRTGAEPGSSSQS